MSTIQESLFQAILTGDLASAIETTNAAIEQGETPESLINESMIRAMSQVGQRFEDGDAFVPDLLMAARAMKGSLDILKPLMQGENSISLGKVVIGTVKGDLHDIGKNLVASMFEGCGFEVVNLGTDVSDQKFIDAIREHDAQIICMSALLTTTMSYMKTVIDSLEAAGLRSSVKVMVGGAPITEEFAKEIGADGFSSNANRAVSKAKELIS